MASLQERGGSYRVIFSYRGKQHSFPVGKVSPVEAEAKVRQAEYLLMRLNQKLIELPPHVPVSRFLQFDGKPPEDDVAVTPSRKLTLAGLHDLYAETHRDALEPSTLKGIATHFKHLGRILGHRRAAAELALADLQEYINKRKKQDGTRGRRVSPYTVKKELVSLRTAINWGHRMGHLPKAFPNMRGLTFDRTIEKPPFSTRAEIERKINAGGLTDAEQRELWDSLFLTVDEIADFLAVVKESAAYPFIYPMLAFTAHTGARKSEVIRVKITDVDFETGVVTLHEKKRRKGTTSRRQVPLSATLAAILQDWLKQHPGGQFLFCHGPVVPRSKHRSPTTGHRSKKRPSSAKQRAAELTSRTAPTASALSQHEYHDHFDRTLKGTRWEVIKGAHALRHSFISALANKGVDQRLIDDFVGHQSDEQRRRYRHLYPSVKANAINSVFG